MRPALCLTAMLPLAIPTQPSRAASLHVPEDYPAIQEAVDAAVAGDVVVVGPGTWRIEDDSRNLVNLKPGVSIIGAAGAAETILDGQSHIAIELYDRTGATEPFKLRGLTLTGRHGLYLVTTPPCEITDCVISGCTDGGATVAGMDAIVTRCRIVGNNTTQSSNSPGMAAGGGEQVFRECLFADNYGSGLDIGGPDPVLVEDCNFTGNQGQAACYVTDAVFTIRRCRFVGNDGNSGAGLRTSRAAHGDVEECLFAGNTGTPAFMSGGAYLHMSRCTFYGNEALVTSALQVAHNDFGGIDHNVFAYNRSTLGHGAVTRSSAIQSAETGCNLFWANEGGDFDPLTTNRWTPAPTDQFIDPLFCDPSNGRLTVAADSPCLARNGHGVCQRIGAFGEGCSSTGTVVSVIRTDPPGRTVLDDGRFMTGPALVGWRPGTVHHVTAPDSQDAAPGRRFAFTGWIDGVPDTTRAILAPVVPEAWTARFDSLLLLTMKAGPGGAVDPPTGWYPPRSVVSITAVPDTDWWFDNWVGTGWGSYSGANPMADVTLNVPITQTATFTRNEDVTIATTPPGLAISVDGQPYVSPVTFAWPRGTQHTISTTTVQFPNPGEQFRFLRWSDGQPLTHGITVPNQAVTFTAEFATDYEVTFSVTGGGTVTPADDWHPQGTALTIQAIPDAFSFLEAWTGTGAGSYSGPQNPVTISVDGAIHQEARFRRISHEIAISVSDMDPSVSTGAPLGYPGKAYLWLVCSTSGRVSSVEADLGGTIPVTGFLPAPGVFNAGGPSSLKLLIANCATGPVLLGTILVADLAGGDLCPVPASDTGLLRAMDCGPRVSYIWPADLKITGVRTDGGAPCSSGRSCSENVTAPPSIARSSGSTAPVTVEVAPSVTALEPSRPNPFSGAVEIRFAMAVAGRVSLSVYDVRGRLVLPLEDREMPAGSHAARWDGRDSEGRRAPAGVYFLRFQAGGVRETRKLVLVSPR